MSRTRWAWDNKPTAQLTAEGVAVGDELGMLAVACGCISALGGDVLRDDGPAFLLGLEAALKRFSENVTALTERIGEMNVILKAQGGVNEQD